jgi:type IV pilus assembly protein PilM
MPLGHDAHSAAAIKESLGKLIKENEIRGEVVTSLPLNKVQVFNYILPSMSSSEIDSAISWKLKQNPPAGATFEGISFDYVSCVEPKDEISKSIRVLVFVVSKELILERIKFFKEFSLELVAVEPRPYASLSVLLWLGKIREDETALALEFGASQSSITIVHAGYPYLIRPLAVSGNSFTEAIAGSNRLDWEKAEAAKRREGLSFWSPQAKEAAPAAPEQSGGESLVLPAIASQMESLVVDIEHTFKYFSHQLMKSQVTVFDRVVLCGGGANLINLDKFLSDRLGVPVDVFNPLSALNVCAKNELSQLARENSASFSSALGLAARFIE